MERLTALVTGATGFVGAAVAAKLLQQGWDVLALFRPGSDGNGARRVNNSITAIRPFLTRRGELMVVSGDVTHPGVFHDTGDLERWRGKISHIIHCAGSIRFNDDNANVAVNIRGAENMAQLASDLQVVRFVHVSTAYVCGDNVGLILEDGPLPQNYSNSYEASKRRGEEIIQEAVGQMLTVVRPSIVVGALDDSWVRSMAPTWEGYYGYFRGFYLLKAKLQSEGILDLMTTRIPGSIGAEINLMPVDHLARICVILAESDDTANGQVFHIAHPQGPDYGYLVETTLRIMGIRGGQIGMSPDQDPTTVEGWIAQAIKPFLPYVSMMRRFSMERTGRFYDISKIPLLDNETIVRGLILPAMACRFRALDYKGKAPT